MKILIFSTAYFPLVGGAEVAVREITSRLPHDFVLVTARLQAQLPEVETIGNVKVIRVGKGGWFDKILLWRRGWEVVKEEKFDLVWGVMASYGGLAALRYKKSQPGVPFLLTLQEGDSFEHIYARAAFIWPWFKQIFSRADFIQAISNYLAVWGKKMGARCPVEVVPNGVGLKQWEQTPKNDHSQKIILSVSRLVEKNGLEYLIRAMPELPPEYSLHIIGDGLLRPKLEKIIAELQLTERVLLVGEIPNQELPRYYAQADVFVRPSLSEGLGIAFLEAMQQDVPVLATPVGGIPDFLEDGVTGWFCKVKDPHDIAEKIKYILDKKNSAEVAQVKKQAQELIQKKYSWEIISQHMNKIFNSLCAS